MKSEVSRKFPVTRVSELVNYASGRATRRPETSSAAAAAAARDRSSDKWSAPEIIELFDSSRVLSQEISKADELARNLEVKAEGKAMADESDDKTESGETRTSVETTKKAQPVTKSNGPPKVFPCAPTPCILSPEKQLPEREAVAPFDPVAWLKSLSLTKLADVHEQICAITSSIVSDDGARLQRRIAQRQREVTARATEARMALLKEQTRLARIADEMNRESSFELHISVDARMPSGSDTSMLCCMRKDCLRVGCAVDFDTNRRK